MSGCARKVEWLRDRAQVQGPSVQIVKVLLKFLLGISFLHIVVILEIFKNDHASVLAKITQGGTLLPSVRG